MSTNSTLHRCLSPALTVMIVATSASGSVQIFSAYSDWSAAAPGDDQKLDFVFGGGLQGLSGQYAQFGVHFELGTAIAAGWPTPSDGWGFISTFESNGIVPVHLDLEQHAFAVDFINATQLTF